MHKPFIKTKKSMHILEEPGIIKFSLHENTEWHLEDAIEAHKAKLFSGKKSPARVFHDEGDALAWLRDEYKKATTA